MGITDRRHPVAAASSDVSTPDPLADLPQRPGVYSFRDSRGRLLYVGKAINLRNRVRSYFRAGGGHSPLTRRLKNMAVRIEHRETGSELEALVEEAHAILTSQPLFNVLGTVERHHVFLRITAEPVARVLITSDPVADGSRYFGPFRRKELEPALEALQKVLKWRRCTRMEPARCLERQIDRCVAPCVPDRDGAGPASRHHEAIEALDRVLSGRGRWLLGDLEDHMRVASRALEFERAAAIRDRLQALERLVGRASALRIEGVLVTGSPGSPRLLALRSGRIAAGEGLSSDDFRKAALPAFVLRFLRSAWGPPDPGPARTTAELREMDLVARYLERHADELIPVSRLRLEAASDEIAARLSGLPPALDPFEARSP